MADGDSASADKHNVHSKDVSAGTKNVQAQVPIVDAAEEERKHEAIPSVAVVQPSKKNVKTSTLHCKRIYSTFKTCSRQVARRELCRNNQERRNKGEDGSFGEPHCVVGKKR